MAYTYLKDATPFTADSLNSRVDTLVSDVNVITENNVQFLALNTVQLPSFVGSAADSSGDTLTSENVAEVVSTPSTEGTPLRILGGPGHPFRGIGPGSDGFFTTFLTGYTITLDLPYTLNRGVDRNAPTALMVMANVEVKTFDNIKVVTPGLSISGTYQLWGIDLNEYTWDATVILELEDSSGDKGYLIRTERQLSPRVTIGAAGNEGLSRDDPLPDAVAVDPPEPEFIDGVLAYLRGRIPMSPLRDLPGHFREEVDAVGVIPSAGLPVYQQFDFRTFQDVSIRTIITKDDFTRTVDASGAVVILTDVKHVRLGFASLNERSYFTQRVNP